MYAVVHAIENAYCNQTIDKPQAIALLDALQEANQDGDGFITNPQGDEVVGKTEFDVFLEKYLGPPEAKQIVSRLFAGDWLTAGFDGVIEKVRLVYKGDPTGLADFNSKSAADFLESRMQKKTVCKAEGKEVDWSTVDAIHEKYPSSYRWYQR